MVVVWRGSQVVVCVGGGNGENGPSGRNGSWIRTAETGLPLMDSTRSIVSTTKMWTNANLSPISLVPSFIPPLFPIKKKRATSDH